MPLHALQALHHAVDLLVAREHHEGGIGARGVGLHFGVQTAGHEDFVVLLVDLAYARRRSRRYQPPRRVIRMSHKQQQYNNQHQHRKQQDEIQRHAELAIPAYAYPFPEEA